MEYLSDFRDLPDESPPYLAEVVRRRRQDLESLPDHLLGLLRSIDGLIVDVGPGEGVSTMALAELNSRAPILGIEMDRWHLLSAWPLCCRYTRVVLAWAAFGHPSNTRVDRRVAAAQEAHLPGGTCSLLFSWLGLSREVMFAPRQAWGELVTESCILVYPTFWRCGIRSLPPSDLAALEGLCVRVGVPKPVWEGSDAVPGFRHTDFCSTSLKAKARGWLLWLSGLFDLTDVYLWDTLTDQRSHQPKFQLPGVELELEVALASQE